MAGIEGRGQKKLCPFEKGSLFLPYFAIRASLDEVLLF
jgi:hypothetical protein